MIYYCISDIHGCLFAFQNALDIITSHLSEEDTALILLGDYIHGGKENAAVLDKIMELQNRYGSGKIIALLGNHEELVCEGMASVDACGTGSGDDDRYVSWLRGLPRYHAAGKTIFVHAGIDEEAEDLWKYGTMDHIFTEKYPAQTGHFFEDYKIVAGHISTSAIAGDPHFHGIYFDGSSHYYIDADTVATGFLNILKVNTETQEYFAVTDAGEFPVLPYDVEH